ncbi:MAG: DUF2185 domain-containing protein [Clostridia bacterium]|nr:DUF2185 domain-containing protein [Clostridia bacterium]
MFDKRLLNKKCIITKSVYSKERKLRWLYREEAINDDDSGWEISSEFDDEEYVSNSDNLFAITIAELIELEPSIENVIEMPVGTEIMYDDEKKLFVNTATNEAIIEPYKPFIQRAFEKNLDFISKMSCDVNIVKELFNPEKFRITESEKIMFSSGKVVLSDPYNMSEEEKIMDVMEEKINPGDYKIIISEQELEEMGDRVFAAKLIVSGKEAVEYKILKPEGKEWEVVGVDTGLCAICDKTAQEEYRKFYKEWKKKNKGKNFYNEYMSKMFEENYNIGIWKSENTNNKILMCSTGFGDGIYNPICGYDENGKLCSVVIMFITPEILEMN